MISLGILDRFFHCVFQERLVLALWCVIGMSGLVIPEKAEACRLVEPPSSFENGLWVHVEGPCSSVQRQAFSPSGAELFGALVKGKNLDLVGVIVQGEVMLDRLPLQKISELPSLPPQVTEEVAGRRLKEVRIIPGSVRIRDSQFDHVLATNLSEGVMIILGEVDFSGSVFVQAVDFSKTIFAEPATFAGMQIGFEGFFIGTTFLQDANFSEVQFGTHSRFHKAVFFSSAGFQRVQFNGVAEFLEVMFHREVNFSHANFSSGVGFSGSTFLGPVDFSGAVFTREIYFRFADFKDQVRFVGTEFRNVADFSHTQMNNPANFSRASFALPPDREGSNLILPERTWNPWKDPTVLLAIAFCVILLVFLHQLRSRKKCRS